MTAPAQQLQPALDALPSAKSTADPTVQATKTVAAAKDSNVNMSHASTSQVAQTPKDNTESEVLTVANGKDEQPALTVAGKAKEEDMKMQNTIAGDTKPMMDEPQAMDAVASSVSDVKPDAAISEEKKSEDVNMEDTKPSVATEVGGDTSKDTELVIPELNSEIEVLWEVTNESGVPEDVWWKARVQTTERRPNQDGVIHVLLYDAYDGFEEEVVRVRFKAGRELIDLSRTQEDGGGVLRWRFIGEGADEEDNIEMSTDTFKELVFHSAADLMSQLSADKQHRYADQVSDFTQRVEAGLERIRRERGEEHEISREEIMNIFSELPRNKRRQ